MTKINLKEIFSEISNSSYVLLKAPSSLDDYTYGSDLDIFTNELEDVSAKIISLLTPYVENNDLIIDIKDTIGRRYIDLILDEKINIRFDLCSQFPKYKNIEIKDSYFDVVIEGKVVEENLFKDKSIKVNITNSSDEFIIRYIEYHEWFESRPDKIKHIDIIQKKYNEDEIEEYVSRLHRYLKFPIKKQSKKTFRKKIAELFNYYLELLIRSTSYIKKHGIKKTMAKVMAKIK
ncbi:hypothetical protein [Providencia sp. M-27]|uniref:hypothetical protein n=1 Tax=Providencia sp. M-27 TaxID=2713150 RepID=UPI00140D20EB